MSKFSNYSENLLANWLRGSAVPTLPALYIAAFSSDPTDTGAGTEVTTTLTGSATRGTVTFAAPVNDAGAQKIVSNSDVIFATTAPSAVTITHFGIFDSPTGGNLLVHGEFAAPMALSIGDGARIYAGNLSILIQ